MLAERPRFWRPIHRNELLPALRALQALERQAGRRVNVLVAGATGAEPVAEVAGALAEFAGGRGLSDVQLLTVAAETGPVAADPAASGPARRRAGKAAQGSLPDGFPGAGGDDPRPGLTLVAGPGLLASLVATRLAGQADGVLLVVSARQDAATVKAAIAALRGAGGHPLGLVLVDRRFRLPPWLARILGLPATRIADWTQAEPQFGAGAAAAAAEQDAAARGG